jgi:hypothetical protein
VTGRSRSAPLALALLALCAIGLGAQAVTVTRIADTIVVRAPAFAFIKGDPLVRLREGRSVRVELHLSVLPRPGAAAATQIQQGFVLSYDLWEERFAVTRVGPPSTAASYLTSAAAEAWCLEQLAVPVAALGVLGRDTPFWIRLEYRVLDGTTTSEGSDTPGFTLRTLIDALSARRQATAWTDAIEAGPFRLRP